jgi:hypothetical protein
MCHACRGRDGNPRDYCDPSKELCHDIRMFSWKNHYYVDACTPSVKVVPDAELPEVAGEGQGVQGSTTSGSTHNPQAPLAFPGVLQQETVCHACHSSIADQYTCLSSVVHITLVQLTFLLCSFTQGGVDSVMLMTCVEHPPPKHQCYLTLAYALPAQLMTL